MALTKVTGQVIKNTTDVTVGVLTVTNTLAVGGTVSIGGTLTYEDVTNIDSVGLITARNGIVVGSGITLSKDGDAFHTGVSTSTKVHVGVDTGVYGEDLVVTGNSRVTGITTFGDSDNPALMLNIDATSGLPAISIPDSIIHSGDTNTKIRFPAADTFSVETGGSERLRITSAGKVGVGTNTFIDGSTKFEISGKSANTLAGGQNIHKYGSASAFHYGQYNSTGDASLNNQANAALAFATNNTERVRIYANGAVLIGADSGEAGGDAKLAIDCQGLDIYDGVGDASNYGLIFANDPTSDKANGIGFFNDSASTCGGYIVHQDKGSGNIGDLVFGTSASSDTPVERMRISKDGHVTKPTQFHILVRRASNQTGYNPSQGFGTGIVYNEVVTTQGTDSSVLDSSNGRITVPVAGIYFLEGSGYSSTAAFTQGWFTKNGSRLTYSDWMNNSGLSQNFNSNGFHKLAAGDAIGFKAYGSAHTSVTVEASIYHTWMRITLVG